MKVKHITEFKRNEQDVTSEIQKNERDVTAEIEPQCKTYNFWNSNKVT